jgi:hypothetical protein
VVFFHCVASMTAKEVGLSDEVLESLAQCFARSPCEVKVWILVCCFLFTGDNFVSSPCFYPIFYLIKTGHSVSFGPAVSHLVCAGFTEI